MNPGEEARLHLRRHTFTTLALFRWSEKLEMINILNVTQSAHVMLCDHVNMKLNHQRFIFPFKNIYRDVKHTHLEMRVTIAEYICSKFVFVSVFAAVSALIWWFSGGYEYIYLTKSLKLNYHCSFSSTVFIQFHGLFVSVPVVKHENFNDRDVGGWWVDTVCSDSSRLNLKDWCVADYLSSLHDIFFSMYTRPQRAEYHVKSSNWTVYVCFFMIRMWWQRPKGLQRNSFVTVTLSATFSSCCSSDGHFHKMTRKPKVGVESVPWCRSHYFFLLNICYWFDIRWVSVLSQGRI